jgi:hypothetical protein
MKVLSLGAGIQSTTLLLMALEGEIERPDAAIFADPRFEVDETYSNLKMLEDLCGKKIPIYRVSKGSIADDLAKAARTGSRTVSMPFHIVRPDGNYGMARRQCTGEYKLGPILREQKELLRKAGQKHAEAWIGYSFDEISRMKPSRVKYSVNRYPLIERAMTRSSCIKWLTSHEYPVPEKSACIGCPFRKGESWVSVRDHLSQWERATAFDDTIRHLPRFLSTLFVHRSHQPLRNVDVRDPAQLINTRIDDFIEECDGVCGL